MINEMQTQPGSPDSPDIPSGSKKIRQHPSLSLLIIVVPILLAYISIAVQNWNIVFDDAFISYRYAQNLAMGHGITWNPGYPPTEGYTNFLLVLILAPVIWAGLDPLLFTRVLSLICVFAISWIVFSVARRQYSCSATVAFMIASIIFLVPATEVLCLVGLETVMYAFFLLATFIAGVTLIVRQQLNNSLLFSCLLFLTMLLRPEAVLIYPVMAIAYAVVAIGDKATLKPLWIGFITLSGLGIVYLIWKYLHFGQLMPNPFYLKASGQSYISYALGLPSVMTFISDYSLILVLAFSGLVLSIFARNTAQRWNNVAALTGFSFVVVYCLFFVHIDTLMDTHGRFPYPLAPLLILLATPTLAKILGFFESISTFRILVLPSMMVAFLLAFGFSDILGAFKHFSYINKLAFNDNLQVSKKPMAMQKEYQIAKALADFQQIKEVKIAFADSGVIPYFTGAIWLDVVGLNDGFIAKTRNKQELVDYFFIWSPDLVIHPGKPGFSWLQLGHGPLGDYLSWSNDRRWDGYEYVGTSVLNNWSYDLQYFVKKSSRFRGSLEGFLKAKVVDGWYESFPLPIGSYFPQNLQPTWWVRQ